MVKVNFFGEMVLYMRVNLLIIILRGKVYIDGMMGVCIKGNGRIIRWRDKVYLHGMIVENIQVDM